MEKLKVIVLAAIAVFAAVWSLEYIDETARTFRTMSMPEEKAGEDIFGSPVAGKPVVLKKVEILETFAPPTGNPREDDVWDFDMPSLVLNARRVTMSDAKSGYDFIPERCLKCHEEEGPGQNFYGNEEFTKVQDMSTADGLRLVSNPAKGEVPTLQYIYKERHLKKVPFDIGAPHENYMKRGY